LRLDDEIKIYDKFFDAKIIAPHTIEIAAMWAILTRLEPPEGDITMLQKMKLYNGKQLQGFTEDNVIELMEKAEREGMDGISPRYVVDKISNSIVKTEKKRANPFMVFNELNDGLDNYSLISSKNDIEKYKALIEEVKAEYEDIIKNEVQKAISADEGALARLCKNYIDNIKAYTSGEKVRNPLTQKDETPNEDLMRSIEEKIKIPSDRKDDFRQQIMNFIGKISLEGQSFDYKSNDRLLKALELKLFEDQKDTIRLHTLIHGVVDDETQEKIDIVKSRLIKEFGYDEESAQDVLEYVSSIFARGESKNEDN
jgi:serine protein kinase